MCTGVDPSPILGYYYTVNKRRTNLNFESINNVSDLVEANNEENPTDEIHASITELVVEHGPKVALVIASDLIQKLMNLHDVVAENKIEEGEAECAMEWAADSRSLAMAKVLLDSIDL